MPKRTVERTAIRYDGRYRAKFIRQLTDYVPKTNHPKTRCQAKFIRQPTDYAPKKKIGR